ncbi:hypothetical protein MVLG_00390 [Microbotryum lychnidis-dioicae p1A1 Lamole]|uniref:Nuclear transport factor 2 domain-containing protein n=1 Tax=Microbotryum lychnidis-dioicae (strain p1A1 Lamole / MvSl-1064) TaxID=683840 RepID=U5GYY1_USTV1|nr:hypothetical protein MVLG_00390 [Microbotryum lychnidis-dioicae p1A1 Lamole]|eukprot:KDE09490.1 hypothetical protein MVLG_00390 [Microbotryum lychnidis-dioicae p1A1 Lamole]
MPPIRRTLARRTMQHLRPNDCTLPKSQHPLDDPTKFVFDCFTLPAFLRPSAPGGEPETVIMACVHGEFTECDAVFDRSIEPSFWRRHLLVPQRTMLAGRARSYRSK